MAYEKIDLETPQPTGKVGEPGPTAWAKARRMFLELYDSWTPASRSLAKLTPASNKLPYFSGQEAASLADFTAFARTLLDDADAAAALNTLGLGTPSDLGKRLLVAADIAAALQALGALDVGKGVFTASDAASARTALQLKTLAVLDTAGVTNGGTGATTAAGARTNLGIKSAALADLIGTVSASGTAIFELISNANGECLRLADGTQFCSFETSSISSTTVNYGSFYIDRGIDFTFPAGFIDIPRFLPTSRYADGSGGGVCWNIPGPVSKTSAKLYAAAVDTSGRCYLGYLAKGRWK